jgi:hypothetical protein
MRHPKPKQLDVVTAWFKIENYAPVARFSALDWADQVVKRQHIELAFAARDIAKLNKLLPDLMANPLSHALVAREAFDRMRDEGRDSPVWALTLSDVQRLQTIVEQLHRTDLDQDDSLEDVALRQGLYGMGRLGHKGYLAIALDASDKEILDRVKDWLKARRQKVTQGLPALWADELQRRADSERAAHELELARDERKVNSTYEQLQQSGISEMELPPECQRSVVVARLAQARETLERAHAAASAYAHLFRAVPDGTSDLEARSLQTQLDKWCEHQVLPYFDLDAWRRWKSLREGKRPDQWLGNFDIAGLLYPNLESESCLRPARDYWIDPLRPNRAIELLLASFSRRT